MQATEKTGFYLPFEYYSYIRVANGRQILAQHKTPDAMIVDVTTRHSVKILNILARLLKGEIRR